MNRFSYIPIKNKSSQKPINLGKSIIFIAFFTSVIMTIYEASKQLILPAITIWESHLITITFSTVVASIASYFVVYRLRSFHNQALSEIKEREKIQKQLIDLTNHLEKMVNKRTSELLKSNQTLSDEIRNKKEIEKELRQSESRYKHIFDQSPLGIFQFDRNCIITDCNNKLIELLGLSRESLLNTDINGVTDKSIVPAIKDALLGKDGYYEGSYFTSNSNSFFYIILKTKPYYDKKGNIIGGIGTAEDITQRQISEEALRAAKDEAERSDKLKSEFLAQMSHEIRTPINSILSFMQLLKERCGELLDEEVKSYFDIIDSSSLRITRTIDLILNMAEIQTGTYKYMPKKFDLVNDVLKPIELEFGKHAKDKGLNLKLCASQEKIEINADYYSINQIFVNLIDNAVKYTEKGVVEINAIKNHEKVKIDVMDTGIGMSEEYLSKLFEPFSQEEVGYTRRYEGNGLGLALVKKYCDINSGNIVVHSQKGKGSRFLVTLPLD